MRKTIFFLWLGWLLASTLWAAKPLMAIVLDDCGFSLEQCSYFARMEYPLTLAVIPGQAYSQKCAQLIKAEGHDLLIHFPWASLGFNSAKKYPIRISPEMSAVEIKEMLSKAIASVPGADGVNNHMGSQLSVNHDILTIFMRALNKFRNEKYFLDSRTSWRSQAKAIAKQEGLAAVSNDVFLDGRQNSDYIESQYRLAVRLAEERGSIIAIGHVNRPITRRVLKNLIIKYNSRVKLVPLHEIVDLRNWQS